MVGQQRQTKQKHANTQYRSKQSMNTFSTQTTKRRIGAAALALAVIAGLGGYHFLQPTIARATSNAAPLDDSKIAPLLSLDQAMETVAARVTPAIVNVAVTAKVNQKAMMMQQGMPEGLPDDMQQFFERQFGGRGQMMPQQPQFQHGIGSGVIISPDGYIITNNHVVDGATDIKVTLSDRRILSAKLIGNDPLTDLAVIKIEGSNFPNIPLGDSSKLQPGQTVLAFGNPFGFRFTVTRGIVSALNRPNPFSDNARKPGEFIQTDAAINPGNSGGPLVDARGEVVGINTFLVSNTGQFSGMGFAIPAQIVRPTVDTLIRDGKVTHGYMGIGITDVTPENSKFFAVSDASGDVITELNGQKVSDAGQLQVEVGQTHPDTTIKLHVLRDGKGVDIPVTLEAMGSRDKEGNESSDADHGKPRWGVGLTDLTPEVREQLQAPRNIHGAVIERVQPGSSADNAGLQRGDVIVQVNRHDVESASDVQQALASVPKGQDALLLVWSNGGNTFRVLHAPGGS